MIVEPCSDSAEIAWPEAGAAPTIKQKPRQQTIAGLSNVRAILPLPVDGVDVSPSALPRFSLCEEPRASRGPSFGGRTINARICCGDRDASINRVPRQEPEPPVAA